MASAYKPWANLFPINREVLPFGPTGIEFAFPYDFSWIFYAAVTISFLAAMGIGANDVANSFATSVGSKTLTIAQALVIAAVFEFAGAVLLGAGVTSTISGGIVDVKSVIGRPDLLMFGMLSALISVTFWLWTATFLELPVSTTHSVIGAVMGFGLAMPTIAVVQWSTLITIVISWFVSPALAATVSGGFYWSIRKFILRQPNSFDRTVKSFPGIVAFVMFVNLFFIITKAPFFRTYFSEKVAPWKGSAWISSFTAPVGEKAMAINWAAVLVALGISILVGVVVRLVLAPIMRRRLENYEETSAVVATGDPEAEDSKGAAGEAAVTVHEGGFKGLAARADANIHKIDTAKVQAIHDNAETFDARTELAFGWVQVLTACAMAFSHGSNDVANSVGPLATILDIYNNNKASNAPGVPMWVLVLGGLGIVAGLASFGNIIIKSLGTKMIKITPSRGACIELATAFVIVLGSYLNLPLSTTNTMVGASIGVGLVDGTSGGKGIGKSINLPMLAKIFAGWVFTIIIAASVSAMFFSFSVYGPSIILPMAAQNCLGAFGTTPKVNYTLGDLSANTTFFLGNRVNGAFMIGVATQL